MDKQWNVKVHGALHLAGRITLYGNSINKTHSPDMEHNIKQDKNNP